MDTGYGNALNVSRTVKDALQLGIAGVILEDQEWPKKCGHFEGKRVIPIPIAEHVGKIRAAVPARGDSGLVIIARTDARAPLGLEDAIAPSAALSCDRTGSCLRRGRRRRAVGRSTSIC